MSTTSPDEGSGLDLDWDAAPSLAARRPAATPAPAPAPAAPPEVDPFSIDLPEVGEVLPLSEEDASLDWAELPPAQAAPAAPPPKEPVVARERPSGAVPSVARPSGAVPSVARELPPETPDVNLNTPAARAWGPIALGALAVAGVVLLLQGALPRSFPSLLEMTVLLPVLTGASSDFFPLSAWVLALLSWGLLGLAMGLGHRLARRAGSPLDMGELESVALVLVPGLNLVGGPYVLRELGMAAESRKAGLRLGLHKRAIAAVGLLAGSVALESVAVLHPGELSRMAALAVRLLSTAAFVAVLSGMGRALWVLTNSVGVPGGRARGWGSAARGGGSRAPKPVWVGLLAATAVAVLGVWFFRNEELACESGTSARHTQGSWGEWVSACVRPSGARHGAEWARGPEGRLLARGEYREGQRHGTFRMWSETGVLLDEQAYTEGQPSGKWKLYLPSGRLLLEEEYVGGKREGPTSIYYASGNRRMLRSYQKGLAHGRYATWFDSGLVEEEGAFEEGRPSGWWVKRDKEGKVVKQWSGGYSASQDTAGVSAVLLDGSVPAVALRAGHTTEWWKARIELLRDKARREPEFVALYELTLKRARASGFTIFEKPEGVVLALEPTP
ncbi:toxin-antitoxin system YwqK family antitoxin [Archangium minus]|uniref:Toxin-antitoxin system YwqK family antitoxin n=1 Tax=Archangium minus TaxID=83450 RepID=A0ABY9WTF2_9BACT|nr:toxin-antitoxin system YwqK family antitoxin [Archangium minus]